MKLSDLNLTVRAQQTLALMTEQIQRGATVHLKWTCGKCGTRQTLDQANTVTLEGGRCEECGHVTDYLQDEAAHTDMLIIYGRFK